LVLGRDAINNHFLLESIHKFSFGRDAFNNFLESITQFDAPFAFIVRTEEVRLSNSVVWI
jgi:hypothetical protein